MYFLHPEMKGGVGVHQKMMGLLMETNVALPCRNTILSTNECSRPKRLWLVILKYLDDTVACNPKSQTQWVKQRPTDTYPHISLGNFRTRIQRPKFLSWMCMMSS